MRKRADLDDGTAALDRRHAALERIDAAGRLESDVELRRGKRIGLAVGADRPRGADFARGRERPVEHVRRGDRRRPLEQSGDHGEAPYRARAGDEHALAEQITGAVDRVQPDGERLGKSQLAQRHVARDRIALPLTQDEVLGEHSLNVRIDARAAEEAHVPA